MTKEMFLEQLEDALVGEVPNSVIYDNKRYYERYFFSELKQGRTEAEVLEELGSPRLIARTIIDMQGDIRQKYDDSTYYKAEAVFSGFDNMVWQSDSVDDRNLYSDTSYLAGIGHFIHSASAGGACFPDSVYLCSGKKNDAMIENDSTEAICGSMSGSVEFLP